MFSIYKRGQGKWIRLVAVVGLLVPAFFLCRRIYFVLDDRLGAFNGRLAVIMAVVASMALACLWGILKVLNSPRSANFLIETEGEMKKVTWPGKSEVVGATGVVIITVLLLAALLFASDTVVEAFIRKVVRLF
jgi:preprotein translocase SecE subunit